MLSALATRRGPDARVALRVNPDVDAGTNDKIATGRATDKFGIPYDDAVALYAASRAMPGIEPVGLATHIGSQILGLAPYRDAFARIADLVHALRAAAGCGSKPSIAAAVLAFPTATNRPRRPPVLPRR